MENGSRKYYPIIVIVLLSLIPIIRWVFLGSLSLRFFSFGSSMTSLGQITGLLGMTLFSINLILSNRSLYFDKIFRGLHYFYNAHKWIGTLSFSLLLFHPIFLVINYLSVSLKSASSFLLPGVDPAINMGIIALSGMIILLGITFYLKIKYNFWRFSHKFMVAVFVFAILHTMLITSDVSRDLFLRYYILFFAILGLLSGVYRAFLRFMFNNDYKFKVLSVRSLNNNVLELELEPLGKKMEFNFGQFVFIKFKNFDFGAEPHPFSITSSETENNLRFVIKSLGDFTNKIRKIETGMIVQAEGPFGSFFENGKTNSGKEIWIAGGVGITPFLSRARSFKATPLDVDLYYCTRNEEEAVLLGELQDISNKIPGFKVIPWYSKDRGYINVESILKTSGDLENSNIYLCGPIPFMQELKKQFVDSGIKGSNVNFEEFNFL